MRRRGMSLIETLVVVAIAVVFLVTLYKLLMGGIRTGEEMTEELSLLTDVRAMVEHMGRDVAAAHVILPPANGGTFGESLTLARYASEDASDRLEANSQNPVYPFFEPSAGASTTIKLKCSRVQYVWDKTKGEVTRTEEKGLLEGKPAQGSGGQRDLKTIADYTFNAESTVTSAMKGPAKHIADFKISYLTYDEKGKPKLLDNASDAYKTACVALSLRAVQNTGLYERKAGQTPTRRMPEVVLATKFWSQRKLSEAMYPEYFSSADDDLRY